MKIGDEVLIHGYIDEIRKDCIIIKNKGGYFGTVEAEVRGIAKGNQSLSTAEFCVELGNLLNAWHPTGDTPKTDYGAKMFAKDINVPNKEGAEDEA